MKTFYFGFFAVFGLVYLAYMTWLTGYRAGYDEGNTKAWITARKALVPHITEPADFTPDAAALNLRGLPEDDRSAAE